MSLQNTMTHPARAERRALPNGEQILNSAGIQIERKKFVCTLKENARGRFLRITEESCGRFNGISIPATGLEDFKKLLDEVTQAQPARNL